MEYDSLQDSILGRQGSDGVSESEIAAAAWRKLLGDLPKDFYESVSYEGRAAIRQALDREIRLMCSDKQKAQGEFEKLSASGGTSGDRLQEAEHAKVAWENVTSFDTYKTYCLTAEAQARQERFHDAEVKKVCEEDMAYLPAVLKKHYWETDLDYLQEAYHKWVESRAYRVFAGHHYRYADIKQEHRDKLLEEWQYEMSKLREQEIDIDRTDDAALSELDDGARTADAGSREPFDSEHAEVQNDRHEGVDSQVINSRTFQESTVREHSDRSYTVEREAASGSGVTSSQAESSQRLTDIQERVANWWNREHGKALFGTEVYVVDYPRSDDWNRWTEDFDQELELEFFIDGAEFKEHNIALLEHGGDLSTGSTEHDINRLLFDDAISFDQINRANGLEGNHDAEQMREDDLQVERSDWNERGR
ncbi:MAG: hypothetical protein EKK48_10435 [Candidatus Melainabacteria bacterium]|nr:MAG: hypothetical protein EKK48_10435 [Candidatus Melainabacteria bacterium]